MFVDDLLIVSDMDVIFIVIISLDSDKVKYWGYMLEIVINSVGVKFWCLLLVVEMMLNSGIYLVNNEIWFLVIVVNIEKVGVIGCDVEYQLLLGDL